MDLTEKAIGIDPANFTNHVINNIFVYQKLLQ